MAQDHECPTCDVRWARGSGHPDDDSRCWVCFRPGEPVRVLALPRQTVPGSVFTRHGMPGTMPAG